MADPNLICSMPGCQTTAGCRCADRVLPPDWRKIDGKEHPDTVIADAAMLAERERCAKIVEGEVYAERYRKWPQVSAEGNRSNDSEITKHCQKLAAIIRAGHG